MTDTHESVETTVLARPEPQQMAIAPQSLTPAQMLSIAVQQDAPVEKIEKLMDLQQRWEANEARKAFEVAMVAFSARVPTILKTRVVDFTTSKGRTYYTHAGLPETVEQIQDLMAECQLSRRWKDETAIRPGNIRIRCIVSHITGHSESFSAEAPPDESGNKNAAQAVASIITYLRRTTLFSVLGLVANDEIDDDGAGGKKTEPPKPKSPADPEADAKKAFWNACQKKAGVTFTATQVRAIFAATQEACGKEAAADCLAYIERDGVLLSPDGVLSIVMDVESGLTEDQTSAAPTGPLDGVPPAVPAPEPPSIPALVCMKCGLGHQVKPVGNKCLGRYGANCDGRIVPNSETWKCGLGHTFAYTEIVASPVSAKGKCPICNRQGQTRVDIAANT